MSNPGIKKKIKNVQMGYVDGTGFHPIRASVDYDEGRLSMPKVLNERKETALHRRVRDVEFAKRKWMDSKNAKTKANWGAKYRMLKQRTVEALRREGYKRTPSWASVLMN